MVHNIKLKKRIWSLLLCLCMVLPCLPVSVFAAGETETACTETDCAGHYENGFCSICDGYQAATLNDNGTTDDTTDDYYEIGNAGQLYWFAAKVNNDKEWNLNGKLTADITVNENLVENVKFSNEGYITDDPAVTPRTWTPIGGDNYNWETTSITNGVGYAGTFDGDGKTISGLYYDSRKEKISEADEWTTSLYAVGLFSFLNGATLRDITVTDSIFYSAHHIDKTSDKDHCYLCLGGIAGGVVAYDKATTIEGCTVTSSVLTANQRSGNGDDASGNYNVRLGGIVGNLFVLTSSAQATIKNCTASHTEFKRVVIADKVDGCGGIVGGVDWNAGSLTIEGCTNASDVTPTNIYNGGIVGFVVSSITSIKKASFTIKNCANTGDVSTPEDAPSSTANVGGILGTFFLPSIVAVITIENCYNTGAVSALAVSESKTAAAAAGGLIGSAAMDSGSITVKNCYNTGAVSALAVSESKAAIATAGVLIGSAAMDYGSITVKNCYNTGAVTAEAESEGEEGKTYAGAVIGKLTGTVTGTFDGIYYLLPREGDAEGAVGSNTTSIAINATEKSAEEFASGEVCYLLNGSKSEGTETDPLVWYQILVEGGDPSPVLDSTHGIVSYDAETGKYSSTGTLTTVSVTITWTSMAFTYTDGAWDPDAHDYAEGTWSTSGGTVTVENTGNVTVTASFTYTATTGITGISGSFDASSFDLAENASQTTTLTLSGKPSKSLNNESIGTITVTIVKKSE